MANFRNVNASTPPTKPAEPEKSFPYWHMQQMHIKADEPGGQVSAHAHFHAYRELEDGSAEMAPDEDKYRARIRIAQLDKLAEADSNVKTVVDNLLAEIERVGQSEGAL